MAAHEIRDIVNEALAFHRRVHNLYETLLRWEPDEDSRKVLSRLEPKERKLIEGLEEQAGKPDSKLMNEYVRFPPENPLNKLYDALEPKEGEQTVEHYLKIAIDASKKAEDYYRQLSDRKRTQEASNLFEKLADYEATVQREAGFMEAETWQGNGQKSE